MPGGRDGGRQPPGHWHTPKREESPVSIFRTIADASAEYAVTRYVPSRNVKTRRRHYRRYYDIVYAALHALAERLRCIDEKSYAGGHDTRPPPLGPRDRDPAA